MQSTSRHLKSIGLLLGSVALTLLIVACGQGRFLEQNYGDYAKIGLFSSCAKGYNGSYQCGGEPFSWTYTTSAERQWKAFAAFLLIHIIVHGITLITMRNRLVWAKRTVARRSQLNLGLPLMQIANTIFGAIALALVCTERRKLYNSYGYTFSLGPSVHLQIAAYVLIVVSYFLYSIGWCCEPKQTESIASLSTSDPAIHTQQVTLNIDGRTVVATLSAAQPIPVQPAQPVPVQASVMPQYQAAPIVYLSQPVPAQVVQHAQPAYVHTYQGHASASAYPEVQPLQAQASAPLPLRHGETSTYY